MSIPKDLSKKLGAALYYARRRTYTSTPDMAQILHISTEDLIKYEQDATDIPLQLLELVLTMGYTMLRARQTQFEYYKLWRMLKRENLTYIIDK